eukprot:scaffold14641_cov99-Amphora_coffeaeformis.AAC.1
MKGRGGGWLVHFFFYSSFVWVAFDRSTEVRKRRKLDMLTPGEASAIILPKYSYLVLLPWNLKSRLRYGTIASILYQLIARRHKRARDCNSGHPPAEEGAIFIMPCFCQSQASCSG